jgi:hypothetical protein
MRRALLIAGGTVGGLGAVLAITPPQITSTQSIEALSGPLPAATNAPTAAPTPQATSSSAAPTKTVKPAPTAAQSTAAAPGGFSGTVTGASFSARNYGTLSATVTFSNGKITNVTASQSPRSWSDNSLSTLIPFVKNNKITVEQIKQNPAAQLPCGLQNSCRSQASYTAGAFWSSVQSAIAKANL